MEGLSAVVELLSSRSENDLMFSETLAERKGDLSGDARSDSLDAGLSDSMERFIVDSTSGSLW